MTHPNASSRSPGLCALAMAALLGLPSDATGQQPLRAEFEREWREFVELPTPAERGAAARTLIAQGSEDVVEWYVLTTGWETVGKALKASGSTRWMRAAAWCMGDPDSHHRWIAQIALQADDSGPAVLAWMSAHRGKLTDNVAELVKGLAATHTPAVDTGSMLPPHDAGKLLKALEAPDKNATGQTDEAQVLRALDALWISGLRGPRWMNSLLRLSGSDVASIRIKAHTIISRLAAELVPQVELLERHARTDLPLEQRRPALLSASYSDHPRPWILLHDVAEDVLDPSWENALERLSEIGNGYTMQRLHLLRPGLSDPRRVERLDETLKAIAERDLDLDADRVSTRIRIQLERAAWADLACHPSEGQLVGWTLAHLKTWTHEPVVRSKLSMLASDYEPRPSSEDRLTLAPPTERVRSYARELLEED